MPSQIVQSVVSRANAVGGRAQPSRQFPQSLPGMGIARSKAAMVRAAGLGLVLAGLVMACGGRTESYSPESLRRESGVTGATKTPDEKPADTNKPKCGDLVEQCEGDTELGECQLGTVVYDTRGDCPWVAELRCYTTREMACNCACPRDRDSQCSSGFGNGPSGRVEVDCF
jgi:hypothetical protein